ncbi:hypothetical protein AXF14_02625 [Actinomyces radicidentis]|uniref:Aminotransferase class I/classII large domain-containing protein n=1 Tax=Actinomyces radicidentis TaxID=111015 RepID=A0A0X8JD42_ACTRD|nr:hypothetical protein AXF14_02625 [Actinomyces radicidentis]
MEARTYPLHRYGRWEIDVADVEEQLDDADGSPVRAFIVINPNNPTGSYVTADDYARLVAICRRHGLPLIADEVFLDHELAACPDRVRVTGRDDVLTFSLDGLSKRLAAPHAKLAWIEVSGPAEEVAAVERRLDAVADAYLPLSRLVVTSLCVV